MITTAEIPRVLGHTAYDRSHKKIGTVGQVYVDNETGQPEWMTVNMGLFGTKETFIPIEPAEVQGDEVIVPFQKEQIKDAPTVDTEASGFLPEEEEARLYDYYGAELDRYFGTEGLDVAGTTSGGASTGATASATGSMTSDETMTRGGTGASDHAMTRSEQRLRVGKESRETGRVRLRKYVITEEQQQTIPVRREEVRVEREPITDENIDEAMRGPEITEAEHEVVLHEERPVVATETVPVERVRLTKDTTVEEETVTGTVRKEKIKTEGLTDEEEQR